MERRHFIQALFAAAGVASLGARAAAQSRDEYAAAFAARRARRPGPSATLACRRTWSRCR